MKILRSIKECKEWRDSADGSVGFVPTMGALHRGHVSLVKISKNNCDKTIVSIFINPAQFGPGEDLESYPKTIDKDLTCLKQENVDAVFLPNANELYNNKKDEYFFKTPLSQKLEGVTRPHFFKGVTMIVSKLFEIVRPSHTVFGQKDAQQFLIISQMIKHNRLPVTMLSGKTIRDNNGLALSSRNSYLSKEEQLIASNIYKGLMQIKEMLKNKIINAEELKNAFSSFIDSFGVFEIDYISIASLDTLEEVDLVNTKALISTAIYFKDVRLIDNFIYSST